MSSITDLQALVIQQSNLLTSVLAELAALKEQVNGSPANTVLSTADQASVDSMDEALTAQIASLNAVLPAPAPAPEPAAAEPASEPVAEPAPSESDPSASSEPSEPAQEPVA